MSDSDEDHIANQFAKDMESSNEAPATTPAPKKNKKSSSKRKSRDAAADDVVTEDTPINKPQKKKAKTNLTLEGPEQLEVETPQPEKQKAKSREHKKSKDKSLSNAPSTSTPSMSQLMSTIRKSRNTTDTTADDTTDKEDGTDIRHEENQLEETVEDDNDNLTENPAPNTDGQAAATPATSKRQMTVKLPEGYKVVPGTNKDGKPQDKWPCPVKDCQGLFTRRATLGDHMHMKHDFDNLVDNGKGEMVEGDKVDEHADDDKDADADEAPIPKPAAKPAKPTRKSTKITKPAVALPQTSTSAVVEQWELEGGTMRDSDGKPVAFSYRHILNEAPDGISVSGIMFNVLRLIGGQTSRVVADKGRTLLCTVARGKINVTLNDLSFAVGANALFTVVHGQRCEVQNLFYEDAVLHVTAVGKEWIE